MTVIRPCDANETVEAWRMALKNTHGPVMLVLSRQKLPILNRREYASANGLRKGGYVLSDSRKKNPDVILISSGAEVHVCLEAAEELRKRGRDVRVVSMPSMELFEAQPESYRKEVLPPSVTARVAVEAGASLSWYKYVGLEGTIVGVDRFGASAPAKVIFEKLGFTAENVVKAARSVIKPKKRR